MQAARGDAFAARSSKAPSTTQQTNRSVPPGLRGGLAGAARMTTPASARAERYITVLIEARIKKELFHSLGRIQRAYSADTDMDGKQA